MMDAKDGNFSDLFDAEDAKISRQFNPGDKITAQIVGIEGESIFLDIGGKSEGILYAAEVKNDKGGLDVTIGDTIEVYFLSSRHSELLFTTTISSGASHDHLEEAWRSGIPIEGFVKEEIKGGFEITLGGGVRAFCPYSQMGLRRIENNDAYLSQHMKFRITSFENNGRNIVVSARAILEEEKALRKEELKQKLEEGQIVQGEVTSLQRFGAFIDIGGVDGLIPVSEISWNHVDNIEEYLHVGQKVSVIVKKIDWDNDRISLSLKETLKDPWDEVEEHFVTGSNHVGKVARLAQFGAFVTLAPGVDGLIHISKLGSGRRIHHPREIMEEGQEIEVSIESIDNDQKRISLTPTDYTAPEDVEKAEQEEYVHFSKSKQKESLGNLGDLLKAKLEEKNK